MHNGVKRKRAISSGSDDNVEPAANVEPSSVTSPVVIDDDDDYEESLDEYTKYMTNKEKCLKQLMDHFKDADVMVCPSFQMLLTHSDRPGEALCLLPQGCPLLVSTKERMDSPTRL